MFGRLREDIDTVFAKDPAARTVWEVLCCYPGLQAIWLHRAAHLLWRRKLRFAGRLLSHFSRWLTGVEIHPGAGIGRRFFIDHGMGVVIGETAEIGDDVLMYQGAVLGGTSQEKAKRHPTIGNNVVIGAGATILGPIEIGAGAKIGAGSVVVKPVPPGATVVGVPGHIAGTPGPVEASAVLEHGRLPDPVLRTLSETLGQQSRLEERVQALEQALEHALALAALPLPIVTPRAPAPLGEADIRAALRDVLDPEVGLNVADLGLIREIRLDGNEQGCEIRMVVCPGCSVAGYLVDQVQRKAHSILGGKPVKVTLLDERWSWSDIAPHLIEGQGI